MTGFTIQTPDGVVIRFRFYTEDAPITCGAFTTLLPFTREIYHARVSGQEIWTADLAPLDIIQENASVFTEPGEVVLGPMKPKRTKTGGGIGIYYGEGKGLDCANIFARVFEEDRELLKTLGESIWKKGTQVLRFEELP